MASVVEGRRTRRRAGLDNPLESGHRLGRNATDDDKARVTAAEHAIAGDWVDDLGGVLDALGLR